MPVTVVSTGCITYHRKQLHHRKFAWPSKCTTRVPAWRRGWGALLVLLDAIYALYQRCLYDVRVLYREIHPPRKQGMEAKGTSLSITPNHPSGDFMLVIPQL